MAEFSAAITPVFSATWSFRSYIIIDNIIAVDFDQLIVSLLKNFKKCQYNIFYIVFVLSSQHFSEQMEDFSNDLFNSFFDDHLLAERNPLLDMDLDPPNPDIQAEHSYSLSGDSAPQSPSMPIQSDDDAG